MKNVTRIYFWFFFQLRFYFSDACWCGNQYPSKTLKENDNKCDSVCSGDESIMCGGAWKLSIYSTGIVGKYKQIVFAHIWTYVTV